MIDPRVIWLRDQILKRIRVAKAVKTVDATWHARERDNDRPAEVDDDLHRVAAISSAACTTATGAGTPESPEPH
jgi:hypothetical protein